MGGEKAQLIQTPTTPAPSASESAADIYKARLQYDPLVAQQEMDIQKQMLPQQSALYQSLYNQYYPEMARQQQALQQQLYPQQSQIMEAGAGNVLQRLQSPYGYTPAEEQALQGIRGRQQEQLVRGLRERANLGGGLYGGRAAGREEQATTELQQAFAVEDINRMMQGGQMAQQQAMPYLSILYPQIGAQQPNISPYQYQSAVPSADQLYQAMYGASQPNYLYQQGQPSPAWGMAGQLGGAAAMGLMMSSIRYKKNIKLWAKPLNYLNN